MAILNDGDANLLLGRDNGLKWREVGRSEDNSFFLGSFDSDIVLIYENGKNDIYCDVVNVRATTPAVLNN